jgi:hypothetical protein
MDTYNSWDGPASRVKLTAPIFGAYIGGAVFTSDHVQVGFEFSVIGHSGATITQQATSRHTGIFDDPGHYGFVLVSPFCARLTGYFQPRHGLFLSGALRAGLASTWGGHSGLALGAAYSGEVGYSIPSLGEVQRLNFSLGFQASGAEGIDLAEADTSPFTAQHGFASVRVEL